MKSILISDLKPVEIQNYLQYAIAPRPICFASTMDKSGNINLSPFSFFNLFSINPPVCIFSPSRRIRDNSTKHTLQNLYEVPQCVINIVNYNMVQQTSLASTEYAKGVNEFLKAGFTELKSKLVTPPRVAEAPVQLECFIKQIIPLGKDAGSGNIVLAEVKMFHINEGILDENGKIDQAKIDLVARLGGDWYCRVTEQNLFKIAKPITTLGIGIDSIPSSIRNSEILTGNNLGQLGNIEKLPTAEEVEALKQETWMLNIIEGSANQAELEELLHSKAKALLFEGDVFTAWKVLLAGL